MKSIFSCTYNQRTDKYIVIEGLVRCINSKRYEVDEDYDFGSIHPDDVIIEMYKNGITEQPGVRQIIYK